MKLTEHYKQGVKYFTQDVNSGRYLAVKHLEEEMLEVSIYNSLSEKKLASVTLPDNVIRLIDGEVSVDELFNNVANELCKKYSKTFKYEDYLVKFYSAWGQLEVRNTSKAVFNYLNRFYEGSRIPHEELALLLIWVQSDYDEDLIDNIIMRFNEGNLDAMHDLINRNVKDVVTLGVPDELITALSLYSKGDTTKHLFKPLHKATLLNSIVEDLLTGSQKCSVKITSLNQVYNALDCPLSVVTHVKSNNSLLAVGDLVYWNSDAHYERMGIERTNNTVSLTRISKDLDVELVNISIFDLLEFHALTAFDNMQYSGKPVTTISNGKPTLTLEGRVPFVLLENYQLVYVTKENTIKLINLDEDTIYINGIADDSKQLSDYRKGQYLIMD